MSAWQNWQVAFLKQARSDWEAYQKTPQGIQLLRHIEIFVMRFEELFM